MKTHDNFFVNMLGKGIIFVFSLQWECVSIEPVHQRKVKTESDVWYLRRMNVRVDKAGDQKLVFSQSNFLEITFTWMIPGIVHRLVPNFHNLNCC